MTGFAIRSRTALAVPRTCRADTNLVPQAQAHMDSRSAPQRETASLEEQDIVRNCFRSYASPNKRYDVSVSEI